MTTVVVAVLVAIASGLGATLLTISHERGAELRGRMLDAADEFSTQVVAALHVARNSFGEILMLAGEGAHYVESDPIWPEIKEAIDRVRLAVNEAQARQARVHLLFGHESAAGLAAAEIITRLRNVELAVLEWPYSSSDAGAMGQYRRNYDAVLNAQAEFSRAVLQQLLDTWPRRVSRRFRQLAEGRGEPNA
jgi:hypothetical protein